MTSPESGPGPERHPVVNPEFPFQHSRIPVVNGAEGFRAFADQYSHFSFCPYVAEKDEEGWGKSTSWVYMNQVLPNFLYVPTNIPKGDLDALRAFFELVQDRQDVLAVNITQPHKSSPILRELYLGDAQSGANVDTLMRGQSGELEPYDLNSTAFVEWFKEDVGSFQGKPVVLVGVGGVGEPIAKKVAVEGPSVLLLVDVEDKSDLARGLSELGGASVSFESSWYERSQ